MIFDMDGTVIDSNEKDFQAWKQMFKEHNIIFNYDEYKQLLGAKATEIIDRYLALAEVEKNEFVKKREKIFYKLSEENGLNTMPFIEDILKTAKALNLKTAIATGARREKLDYALKRTKLNGYFDVIVTADDVINGKPNPEVFLKAIEKLGVSPEDAVIWEDAELGVMAAKNANIKCIAITTTNGSKSGLENADITIDSYEDLDLEQIFYQLKTLKS